MAASVPKATSGSEVNSDTKPKARTAVNGRCLFDDLGILEPDVFNFSMGAPSFTMMARLKPLFVEATKQRMVCSDCDF
jgi:hypothetical protein